MIQSKHFATCCCDKDCTDWALLMLRLAIGIIFVLHGYGKLFGNDPGMEAFTGMVANVGFPAPTFFAYVAALTEFFGGIAMILGIFTRIFGPLLAFVMLVAFLGVKKGLPAGDPDLALFAIAVALAIMGPGKYALLYKWRKDDCDCGGTCRCGKKCGCGEGKNVSRGSEAEKKM